MLNSFCIKLLLAVTAGCFVSHVKATDLVALATCPNASEATSQIRVRSDLECSVKCTSQPSCLASPFIQQSPTWGWCHLMSVSDLSDTTIWLPSHQQPLPCIPFAKVVDGQWTLWSSWQSCTKACGTGSRGRSRSCSNPTPKHGGKPCPPPSSETMPCNTHNCPIHGGWTSWSGFGSCSKPCNYGSRARSRSCSNPSPQYGGSYCPGSSTQTQSCNTFPCPIHGNWGSWSGFGSCSRSCNSGSQIRNRYCNNPAPQHGGNACAGSSSHTQSCNTIGCGYLCYQASDKGQNSYVGTQSRTVSGKTCMVWAAQSPHSHTNPKWGHNYCRNPDNEPRPWCYTIHSGTRWELCPIPQCA